MRLLFVCILSLISITTWAQRKIIIRDQQTLEPIAGATVLISENLTIQTDQYGEFLPEVSDTTMILITASGYQPLKTYLPAPGSRQDLFLQRSSGMMGEVVVTGTMRTVQRSASPVPVEVYTPAFFIKNPTPNLFDALQMINGVRPQLNCNVCNTGDIHINGLEGPYTMILIDGMPIVSSLASVYGLSGIPNSLIERIEVVKGPASSLYGSEAIGGLINVITKNPLKAPIFSLDLNTTSWNEMNADLGVKFRLGTKVQSLLGINYFNYSNPIDENQDGFTDVTLQHRISVFNKMTLTRKLARQASLAIRYNYEDRWGGEMNWNKQFRGGDSVYGESIYTSRLEITGNYELPVREKILFAYSFNNHDQRSAYGNMIFNARQQTAFGQLTWEKEKLKHNLLLGLVTRYNYYDDNTVATIDSGNLKNRPDNVLLPGIFVQDEIHLNPKNTLLFGARYDYDKRHGNIFTPRIAYKFSSTDNNIFRVNAGTGFRVVNLFTEDHAALTGAREVVIKGSLKPEKSYNININYLKKIQHSMGWMHLDFSAWYTYFTNKIIPDYETNPNQIIYQNLSGNSISRGVSVNAEMGFTNSLQVTLGGTLMDVSVSSTDNSGKSQRSRQLLTENWTGTWTISYTFQKPGIIVDYTGNIYGPMLLPLLSPADPRDPESPIWSIQNIQVTKKAGKALRIYGGVKNLLNWTPAKRAPFLIARSFDPFDKQVQFDSQGKVVASADNPYGLTFDPTYMYAPNQGLRLFAGLRLTINDRRH